jgi:uncharacterized protein YecT (DUF1311 family)
MRAIVLAIVAIQVGLALPAVAETETDSDRSISDVLPLFKQNHCETVRDPAEQLFCADPELNAAALKLNGATQDRLNRIPDRRHAIEENVQWIRDRNLSCGINGQEAIRFEDVEPVSACLLKETEERIAILRDQNFDCLAVDNAAGALICSDPALAIAELELNEHVLALIAKLNENEAKDGFAEYARWSRERDRKCNLVGKENVPLSELSSSEGCLADYLGQKTAEIVAAKGDPRRVFGRHLPSPTPNADAVDVCVSQIHAANTCEDFLRVSHVFEIDSEVAEQSALVTAEVEMVVLSPFSVCSPVASSCTGTCWDLKSGKANPSPASRDSFGIAHRLRIEKAFAFQRTDSGSWRCDATALKPVDFGVALGRR